MVDGTASHNLRYGDFVVEGKLGEGGMGVVYRARQLSLDRPVALKVLPKGLSNNEEFVKRFVREARAAASLIHPNVVQVYAVGEDHGTHYFAMEFVEGASLDNLMRKGRRFSVAEAVEIAAAVARALVVASERGIVHRDIKPGNIMIDRHGTVKVTDFGLARATGDLQNVTLPGYVVGTPAYMSPEQASGGHVDCRSDMYSLGVVLYEVLTGTSPFKSDSIAGLIFKHLNEMPKPPGQVNPAVPPQLDAVVMKCLAKRPEDRFATPKELLRALSPFLSGGTEAEDRMMVLGARGGTGDGGAATMLPFSPTRLATGEQALREEALPAVTPIPAAHATPSPGGPATATFERTTDPTMRISPRRLDSPVKALIAGMAAALFLVVAAGATAFYFVTRDKTFMVSFPWLKEALPAKASVSLSGDNLKEAADMRDPAGIPLPPGRYRLKVTAPGYREVEKEFVLSEEGEIRPPLDKGTIKLEPGPELAEPCEKARLLLEKPGAGWRDAEEALRLLAEVEALDPDFRDLKELRRKAENIKTIAAREKDVWVAEARGILAAERPQWKDIEKAAALLKKAGECDPGSADIRSLQGKAERLKAEAERKWEERILDAEKLDREAKWKEAKEIYDGVAEDTPLHHRLHDLAQRRATAIAEKMVAESKRKAEEALKKQEGKARAMAEAGARLVAGRLDEARKALESAIALGASEDETRAVRSDVERAAKLLEAAEAGRREKKYDEAAGIYAELLKLAPDFADARKRMEECVAEGAKLKTAVDLLERASRFLENGRFDECISTLDEIAKKDAAMAADRAAMDMRRKAEDGRDRRAIGGRLADLDAAFACRDFGAKVAAMLDPRPSAGRFRQNFEEDARRFADAGIVFLSSRRTLKDASAITIGRRAGQPGGTGDHDPGEGGGAAAAATAVGGVVSATVECEWDFRLRLLELDREISAAVRQKLAFEKVDGKWWLAGAEQIGGAAARGGSKPADGPGGGGTGGRILAEVVAVEGDFVALDKGSEDGIRAGMAFDIFERARAVILPMTKETVLMEERSVARIEAVKVDARSCLCAFAPDTPEEAKKKACKGMLAASSSVPIGRREFPVVISLRKSADEAPAGKEIDLELEVVPADGAFVHYRWSAAAKDMGEMGAGGGGGGGGGKASAETGMLLATRTTEPKTKWVAPAAKGVYEVTVEAVAPSGRTERRSVEVRSSGTSATPPRSYLAIGTVYEPGILAGCRDMAFDERGNAYVLDGVKRRILIFGPDVGAYTPSLTSYGDFSFDRLAVRDGTLWMLSTAARTVKRYKIKGASLFGQPLQPDVGGPGIGNGKLTWPIDIEIAPSGDVLVLDSHPDGVSACVQVFSPAGTFLQSFGSVGPGALEKPVAVTTDREGTVYVLDAGAKKVFPFRDGRPGKPFPCPGAGPFVDICYDASTDSLLVLDGGSGMATPLSTSGEKRQGKPIGYSTSFGQLQSPSRVSAGRSGIVLIASAGGRVLDRFSSEGTYMGRLGRPVGDALSAGARIACGPGGSLVALDVATRMVRRFDRDGWQILEFGGEKVIPGAKDLVCDIAGNIYVLDEESATVAAFDPSGGVLGTYGPKGGRPPEGLVEPQDIATDRVKTLGVVCWLAQNSIYHYSLGSPPRPDAVFPPAAGSTKAPKLLALDADGRTYLYRGTGNVDVYVDRAFQGPWPSVRQRVLDMECCAGRLFLLDAAEGSVLACDRNGVEAGRARLPASCATPHDMAASDYELIYVFDNATRSIFKFRGGNY
ncbi:MAG: protein kinase [Planctomycetota bacterium]|nr:protein kinase [Planctomycetota bacterium]